MAMRQLLNVSRLQLQKSIIRSKSKSKSPIFDGGEHANMNDLPIPEGDWNEWYSRRNTKNSIILGIGVLSVVYATVSFFTDESVYFNFKVPDFDSCS